jgi:predicted MPP superfamily phosphohydrolase
MNKTLQFIGFAAIISAIYFSIHVYVFSRLAFFFALTKNLWFYFIIVLLVLSFGSATVLERKYPNAMTRVFYMSSATWLGFIFLLLLCMAVYEIVHLFFVVPRALSGLVVLGVAAGLTLYSTINASSFRVSDVTIPLDVSGDVNIVQISDAHLGTVRNSRYLAKIVDKTNSLNPDLVVVTGDLFDGTAPLELETISDLDTIRAPVFFVTGNHENYEGIDNVLAILRNSKVKVLRNQVERFKGIQIVGIDFSSDKTSLEKILSTLELSESEPTLLLYHVPVKAETLHKLRINVQLAGHTHKGQIFPYMLIDRLAYAYLSGLHGYENSWVYVSAGSGTWGPPMRLGTKSEIALIRLKKPNSGGSPGVTH